jgi:hypothetical protein
VTEKQFKEVIDYQNLIGTHIDKFSTGSDSFGHFLEVKI